MGSAVGYPKLYAFIRDWNSQRTEKGWWHSFELPDGTRIEGVNDLAGLKDRIEQFPIPNDLRGKRVLDIGTWDGWFAFEMERRGADVVAIDCWDNPLFREMHARLGSRVDYRQIDMYDLTPERVGRFDIVLFMGVLYHLKHPLLALEPGKVRQQARSIWGLTIMRTVHTVIVGRLGGARRP